MEPRESENMKDWARGGRTAGSVRFAQLLRSALGRIKAVTHLEKALCDEDSNNAHNIVSAGADTFSDYNFSIMSKRARSWELLVVRYYG